jgi:hypothetical protein
MLNNLRRRDLSFPHRFCTTRISFNLFFLMLFTYAFPVRNRLIQLLIYRLASTCLQISVIFHRGLNHPPLVIKSSSRLQQGPLLVFVKVWLTLLIFLFGKCLFYVSDRFNLTLVFYSRSLKSKIRNFNWLR